MSEWTDMQFRRIYDGRIISKVVGITKEPGYPNSAYLMMDARIGYTFDLHAHERDWGHPDGIGGLVRRNFGILRGEPEPEDLAGVLIRDPANPYDANAIEVHVPMLECRVGFLPTKLAQDVAPMLDEGERFIVSVWAVPNLDKEEFPGIRVLLTPVWLDEAERIVDAIEA